MMILCLDISIAKELEEKFRFVSMEELDGTEHPVFFCEDVNECQPYINTGSCIPYEIMLF